MCPGVFATGCEISGFLAGGLASDFASSAREGDGCLVSVSPCILAGWCCSLVRSSSSALLSRGRPGWLPNSCSLTEKGTGFGGTGSFANTFLDSDSVGGAAARSPPFVPRMLLREGATLGASSIEASFSSCSRTGNADFATGSDFVSTVLGTAVTAPGTFWFA